MLNLRTPRSTADDSTYLSTMPSSGPPGFSSYSLMNMIKDPALTSSDAALSSALSAAGLNPDARLGVFIKYASKTTLDEHHYILVGSYSVSCNSTRGPIDAREDHAGMVLYAKGGEVDWHCNGVHCQAGYISFKKTSEIQHISSDYGQVHGKLYKSLFNEEPSDVIGSGFSIRKGQWAWKSYTFNDWLPAGMQSAMMDEKERVFVKDAVLKFANTGEKVSRIADPHELFLLGPDSILLRRDDVASITGVLGNMLISEGHDNIIARGSGGCSVNNSIHFEVSWKKGGKSRSFYMRKPPHFFVYQLAIDIEAHIKVRADSQVLSLYGAELQPFQRLSSCGLRDGDIIKLMRRTGKQQAVQLGGSTSQLLGHLLPASVKRL